MEPLLTVAEVAAIFKKSKHTIRKWIKEGVLRAIKPGDSIWLVPESEVRRVVEDLYGAPMVPPSATGTMPTEPANASAVGSH